MSERVEVVLEGEVFSVDRAKLAENMQRESRIAKTFGRRPGQQTRGLVTPDDRIQLSGDALAVSGTVIAEHAPELG